MQTHDLGLNTRHPDYTPWFVVTQGNHYVLKRQNLRSGEVDYLNDIGLGLNIYVDLGSAWDKAYELNKRMYESPGRYHRQDETLSSITGRHLSMTDPRPEQIDIYSIAVGLSHRARYAGQTRWMYSVGHHCLAAAWSYWHQVQPDITPKALRDDLLWILMHDAFEAFTFDMPAPIKHLFPAYLVLEDRFLEMLAKKYDLPWPIPTRVNVIDIEIRITERAVLGWSAFLKPEEKKQINHELGMLMTPIQEQTVKSIHYEAMRELIAGDLTASWQQLETFRSNYPD